jgi:hypothetical protein
MRRFRASTLAAALLLTSLGWLGAAPTDPKPLYVGAANLYSLDDVTVVYPSGGDTEGNRASAERRAAFLIQRNGIDATVAADTEVSEEQLAGNLLLLGWENRLLGTREAPPLFQRSGALFIFLGSIPVAGGEDLLFAFHSPYNPERTLVFWSRIDPELDRLLALPFLGSDWAVYRDFKVVAQGSFARGDEWPPVRNPGAEKRHQNLRLERPAAAESEHYTLHYSTEALDAEGAAAILKTRESALAAAIGRLGGPGEDFHIQLYVYRNGEQKEELTGVPSSAHSIPSRLESHMTLGRARSSDPAEEIHVLASRAFGVCHSTAMVEGLVVAMGEQLEHSDLPAYAALLVEGDNLPTLEELFDEDKLDSLLRKRIGLPASGLMVSWISAVGGREALATAYTATRPSVADLASWMGREPSAIEDEFRGWVENVASGAEQELAFRQAVGESQRRYDRGDYDGAAEALVQALEAKADDPEILYKLAMTLMRAGEESRAKMRFLRLVELQVAPEQSRYVIFAHYQLGKLYDGRGKPKKARVHYMAMLEMPDEYDAHRKAREALGETPP